MAKNLIDFKVIQKKWRKSKAYQKAYQALESEFELYEALIKAKQEAGLSQKQIAARMGTSEPALSRLLGDPDHMPSWSTIIKFADAIGKKPVLHFIDLPR